MKNIQILFLLFTLLFSCGDAGEVENKKTIPAQIPKESRYYDLNELQDSLRKMQMELSLNGSKMSQKEVIAIETKIVVVRNELIDQNLSYFRTFPEDSLAPFCLMNVHNLYEYSQNFEKAISTIDTIEFYYPQFELLSDLIELKAVTLELDIEPRDTARLREVYNQLLLLPNLPNHKKEYYLKRLSNIDKRLIDVIGN